MRLNKRTLAIVCVALLVALAGCSGGPGDSGDADDDGDEPANESDPANGSDGGDTGDDGGQMGDSTGQMSSAFTSQKGEIVRSHSETLTAAGSFTATVETTISGNDLGSYGGQIGEDVVTTITVKANPETGEYLQTMESSSEYGFSMATYSPPNENVTYTRFESGGQPFYLQGQQAVDPNQYLDPVSESFFDPLNFESAGTVTRNGETLEKYVIQDVQQVEQSAYFNGSLSTIDVEVLYNPSRNLMQEMSWKYTTELDSGESFSSQSRVSYTDIGSTSVEEPSWLSDAKQQAIDTGSFGNISSGDVSGGDFSGGDIFQTPG